MARRSAAEEPAQHRYAQLRELLREAIATGELKPGEALPPERELAERHGISRMTVRQALSDLVADGLLYRQPGLGTFVANPKIAQPLSRLTSFTEDMRSRGLKPGSQMLGIEVVEATHEVARALEVDRQSRVLRVRRLRLADGQPMALESVHLPLPRFAALVAEDLTDSSLYRILEERMGVHLARARQFLEPASAGPQEVQGLGIRPGSLLLLLERVTYDPEDVPVEYVRSFYRGDRYRFVVDLTRL